MNNEKDEMESWRPTMESLLGKEKWDSLTYWQKMCEIAALQQYRANNKENMLFPFLEF